MLKQQIQVINLPKTVERKDSAVKINWENVFNVDDGECIYDLQYYNDVEQWKVAYWGRKKEAKVGNLAPCTVYNLRLKCYHDDIESQWLEFKSATSTDQYYVRHLTRAIHFSKMPIIRKIITNKPFMLEVVNRSDKTPLVQAIEMGDLHIVTYLVNLGAKINRQSDFSERSPLMVALFHGCVEIAEYLLTKGANVQLKDVNDRTALHYAVDADCLEGAQCAVKHGADINAQDNKGWTPLLRAVIMGASDDLIDYLIKNGADKLIKDNRGFDFAEHCKLTSRLITN